MTNTAALQTLQQWMRTEGLDYYLVPSTDAYFSEQVHAHWARRAFISGFDGSMGDLLVGQCAAWLWVDSRYFVQAETQLGAEIKMMRIGQGPSMLSWLAAECVGVVGVDPELMSLQQYEHWQSTLQLTDLRLEFPRDNAVDRLWKARAQHPNSQVVSHELKYSGLEAVKKIAHCRSVMQQAGCDYHLVTALDCIAWLTNCRGQDQEETPLFESRMVVGMTSAKLYVDVDRVTKEAQADLDAAGVEVCDPGQLWDDLSCLRGCVWLDPSTVSVALWERLPEDMACYYSASPIMLAKACKNTVEQQGMRDAHRRDGIAMTHFFAWLASHWRGLTEVSAAESLETYRQQQPDFQTPSFATICGVGEHGAIVHYHATAETAKAFTDDALILLDSGGQYLCGTTDITRMIHLGQPTSQQREHYTLVLKGHLALTRSVFPRNTCGDHLDVLARQYLWQAGLNYGHGTGHGVGCYLGVHEGPQRIVCGKAEQALLPGMVLSNEPGVYFEGEYGIRIENLLLVVERGEFLAFETLTCVPYNRKLIDLDLLLPSEIAQIDEYHDWVWDQLSRELEPSAQDWLRQATAPCLG